MMLGSREAFDTVSGFIEEIMREKEALERGKAAGAKIWATQSKSM